MYEKILVPLDGSKLAELALPYAEKLTEAFDSELVLFSSCAPADSKYLHLQQLYIGKMVELVKSHIKEGAKVKIQQATTLGEPAREIVNYAKENNVSLIIMSSHGRSGIMLWAMGSTANKVIQQASTPILLIKAKAASPLEKGEILNRILIPLDGSDTGEAVLPYARELAEKLRAEIILLQVIAPGKHVHTVGGLDYFLFPEQEVESLKAKASEYLEKVSKKLTGSGIIIKYEVKIGDAAQEIIRFANETDSRLVIISSHGQSNVRQWILGSIANKILQASNTPVLLVRAPQEKQ